MGLSPVLRSDKDSNNGDDKIFVVVCRIEHRFSGWMCWHFCAVGTGVRVTDKPRLIAAMRIGRAVVQREGDARGEWKTITASPQTSRSMDKCRKFGQIVSNEMRLNAFLIVG